MPVPPLGICHERLSRRSYLPHCLGTVAGDVCHRACLGKGSELRLAQKQSLKSRNRNPAASREDPEITKRRAAERKTFTDAEIIDGFFRTVFGAEFHVAGRVDRIRKYENAGARLCRCRAKPDRRAQLAAVVADIRSKVQHLDIAMADKRKDANVLMTMVRDRDIEKTIRQVLRP